MQKKTDAQKNIIRRRCRFPFFWLIQSDKEFFMVVRNWITGTVRVIAK